MDEPLQRLTATLRDRYEIVREIGRGGMATVYLARDLRHDRDVAIKLFRPELATEGGAARFAREIEVAAGLSHPGILTVHDSGSAEGIPYYVMPYVDGESLAGRVAREGQLPIGEAIRIARQVALALQHAHDRGVVHRDIKPDNIMLAGDAVLIADFGIARAVERFGSDRLTATGLSVGTPTYMSPEQIGGAEQVDGRADIYSLGCVLYTMLIGEPPFSGASLQAVLARHLAEPVPSLRVVRSTITPSLEAVVHRALAKSPVDRFARAADLAEALAPEQLSKDTIASMPGQRPRRRGLVAAGIGVAGLLVMALVLRPWTLTRRPANAGALDHHLVAILPFTLGGMADSTLRIIGRQLPEMLVQRLPGDGGPRAILTDAPGDVTTRVAARNARRAGAGLVLQGHLTSLSGRLTLGATLRRADTDSLLARVDDVTGSADSLPILLDRMVSGLLIAQSGVNLERATALANLPLPALRQYFASIRLFMQGRMPEAGTGFDAVLAVDSTCYPAALWLLSVRLLQRAQGLARAPLVLALAQQHRMSQGDTIQLHSLRPWSDEAMTQSVGAADRLQRLGGAATALRQPETWYLLAERYFHDGPLLGLPDMLRQAARSFERALELEPDLLPALGHSIDLAAARGDTAAIRHLARRYFALDSVGDLSDYYRWRVATALDDPAGLRRVRERMSAFSAPSLEQIVNVAQLDGVGLDDARRAAEILWTTSDASSQARWAFMKQRELALNRGRPAEAAATLARWRAAGIEFRLQDGMAEVVNVLHWGADSAAAAAWVRDNLPVALARVDREPQPQMTGTDYVVCGVGLWRALRGDGPVAPGSVPLSDGLDRDAGSDDGQNLPLCAAVISAAVASRNAQPEAGRLLLELDSLVASLPPSTTWLLATANLTAARLWERRGALDRALAAVRRRPYITDVNEPRVLVGLATMLREEGRLAAMTGDTAGALLAYRRYLALHDDPEPAVAGEVEAVRLAVRRLAGN